LKKRYLWCLLFWGLTSISSSQELSTSVFPSEDELLEALNLGEIDIALFVTLQEIYLHGVDSSRLHELDGIPNLVYIAGTGVDRYSRLELEQFAPFSFPSESRRPFSGYLRHKYYQYLDADNLSRYRTNGRVELNQHWCADFALQREYSHRERLVYRSVMYHGKASFVRELVLGNFSRRLGLGTVFGYRGKLLSFSDHLDSESFLYPDYGGYNGFFFSGQRENVLMQGLVSHNRDTDHSQTSMGGMFTVRKGRISPGIIVGLNRLRDRHTGALADDIKLGGNVSLEYPSGYNAAEAVVQAGIGSSFAFVDEGWYRSSRTHWRYAFWIYGNDFLDVSSGSKAGELYRSSTLTEVDFDMSNRRRGQKGGLVKSIVTLSERWEMENSLLVCAINDDSLNMEMLWGLTRMVGRQWTFRLDFLGKHKRRRTIAGASDDTIQRPRFQVTYGSRSLSVRSFVGYVHRTDTADMVSLFATARLSGQFGDGVLWANIGRYNVGAGRIDYLYGFISDELPLYERLRAVVKLSHSYNRDSKNQHLTVVSVELEATL